MTLMTVSLPSADIGLTGVMTAVLIRSFPSQRRNCDHARNVAHQCPAPVVAVVGTTMGGRVSSNTSRRTLNQGGRLSVDPTDSVGTSPAQPGPPVAVSDSALPGSGERSGLQ